MNSLTDFPRDAFKAAIEQVWGRILLYFTVVVLGAWLGISFEAGSLVAPNGLIAIVFLGTLFSIFLGGLIFVFIIIGFAFIFARFEIPIWTLAFPFLASLVFYAKVAAFSFD